MPPSSTPWPEALLLAIDQPAVAGFCWLRHLKPRWTMAWRCMGWLRLLPRPELLAATRLHAEPILCPGPVPSALHARQPSQLSSDTC